ncbi:MAG: septal ring lytic transglycosylase RlpA family protein [Synechococcales cyanobacterium CRU_2_2]|nr:septal ring lytic transglycosylase RlpA family protein [Synechococcales cyanobacterium CRU_2_2]
MAAPTLASVGVTAPVAAAATLLPKWPGAQNGILDFAQPLTRWLAGSPSLQSAARHPKAFSPTDQLACFSGSAAGLAAQSKVHNAKASGLSTSESLAVQAVQKGGNVAKYKGFSAWVRSCMLRDLSDPAEVEAIATRIEAGLAEAHWDGEKVLPTLAENLPSGKVGDRLLFIITPEIAEAVGANGELVTTHWINELRLVLGAAPLELAESQIYIHGLKPTGKYLSGEASWYGHYFQGRLTATGEIFDKEMFTAAHRELPFDTYLKVTNLHTGNVLIVRINDRGPYVGDRDLDLSQGSAHYLGSPEIGVVNFKAEFMEPANRLQASLPYRVTEPDQDPLITMWRP